MRAPLAFRFLIQALAKRMGAVLASYDVEMSDTRRAFRGETDQVRIALNAFLDALFFLRR